MVRGRILDNPWNEGNQRKLSNTNKSHYNCGGYALGLFNWFIPWTEELDDQIRGRDLVRSKDNYEEFLTTCVKYMVEHLPVREINSLNELEKREYAVAFRLAIDDFHFIKRGFNGVWYDKQGWCPSINTHTEDKVLNNSAWYGRYNSRIVLLAMEKRG